MLYRLYIGSNNKTKKLEDKKAFKIISEQFEGYTAFKGLGYWNGTPEKTLIVEIEAEKKNAILELAQKLAEGLHQDAIGLASIGKMQFIS